MKPAISVENLGKCYRVSHHRRGGRDYRTLRESLTGLAAAPLRRLRGHGADSAAADEDFWALKNVSFDVKPGEVVGIIGRNGAGKSTLLKVLSRITKPTTGSVRIHGRVGSLLEVGTGFHPELSGRENIYLNGSILGMSRTEIDRNFDAIVDFSGVEHFLDTPVKRYSSGMHVRLAFAVAAHLRPEILIIDEVLAVGDSGFQARCLNKVREISESGATVLIVSHQLNTMRHLCAHALWLDKGILRAHDSCERLIHLYLNETANRPLPGQWVDLTTAIRRGSGETRFCAANFEGQAEGTPPLSDAMLKMRFEIESHRRRWDTHVAFQIRDHFGTRLVDVNTIHRGAPPELLPGRNTITFEIEKLHLAPGTYRVSVEMGTIEEHFDHVADAFLLDVTPAGDYDGLLSHWGMVTREFRYTAQQAALAG